MIESFQRKPLDVRWLYVAAILLLFPALLINLGLLAFFDDEGIRSLVALEMKLSGNFTTPTLFGEFYYNKPPLYNWILLAFFELTGRIDELTARLPTVFFLLAYAGTVFYFFKKHFNTRIAFLNAFALITCGRILFWDSMLGLIDICFSWVIFTLFMVIYHAFQKRQFYKLFSLAYFLAAVAFMLKGLPALVFLGTALLVFFLYKKQFKKLFSLPHFLGMLVFLVVVGSYYWGYQQQHSLENVFTTLFEESSKRTFVKYGWQRTILHLFSFPFEMIYHFLPWSLLLLYFFKKEARQEILKNSFVTYNLLIFFATIIVYWSSVEVYPRYLLMHVPLLFSAFFYLHFKNKKENSLQFKIIFKTFGVLCSLAVAAAVIPLFLKETQSQPFIYLKVGGIAFALAILAYLYFYKKESELLILIIVLLSIRNGFNWFVLPNRLKILWSTECRETSIQAAQQFKGRQLSIYKYSLGLQPANGFYLTRETGRILKLKFKDFEKDSLYIINPQMAYDIKYKKLASFKILYEQGSLDIGILK